jgi:hypothetical protein
MASQVILTLRWDSDIGEAKINFDGMDKLWGVEKADFLNDVIYMLMEHREQLGNNWADDYADLDAIAYGQK